MTVIAYDSTWNAETVPWEITSSYAVVVASPKEPTGVSSLLATMAATLVKRRPTVKPNDRHEKLEDSLRTLAKC